MTFQGSSHPPAPRSGAFPSAVSHYPNYHSGFLSPLERRSAGTVLLQSSRPGIISVLGTQHYRQHWRRASTLRAGKTNCVCSDLMFTSAQRGCLVFLGCFFLRVLCANRLPAVSCGCRCGLEAGRSGRVRVCSRIHTSAPPPLTFPLHAKTKDMKGGCGRVRRVSTQSVLLYLLLCYSETRGGGLLHNASQLQKPETLSVFFF